MSLSDRIRPNCEAAPWVVEEVQRLERENAALRADKERLTNNVLFSEAYQRELVLENAALREALSEAKARTAETMEWRDELLIKWRAVLDAARNKEEKQASATSALMAQDAAIKGQP